jgi:hypothetical protein
VGIPRLQPWEDVNTNRLVPVLAGIYLSDGIKYRGMVTLGNYNTNIVTALALAAVLTISVTTAGIAFTGTTSAASATTISLTPTDQTIDAGDTATYEVVVDSATDGIGTQEYNLTLDNPSLAGIDSIDIAGSPGLKTVDIADDGSRARVEIAYLSTAIEETGSVTIATVTVSGNAAGEANLTLSDPAIADTGGAPYDITDTSSATVQVQEALNLNSASVSPDTLTENQTATQTVDFDVGQISADGNSDQFKITFPSQTTITDPNVSVTDANNSEIPISSSASISDANNGSDNQLTFGVQPDHTTDADRIDVEITTETTVGSLKTNATENIEIELSDSSGNTASGTTHVSLVDADTSDGSDNTTDSSNATVFLKGPPNATASEPTKFDVVISNPDAASIGSYEFNLSLADKLGNISAVDLKGGPSLTTVDIAEDKSKARVEAALAETVAESNVTVAEITVTPTTGGTEQISLSQLYFSDTSGSTILLSDKSASQELPIAAFETTYSLSATEVEFGESLDVSATVSNIGDARGTTSATVYLNDQPVKTEEVTLSPGASSTIDFVVEPTTVGANSVRVGDLSPTEVTVVQPGPGDVTGNNQPAKDPDQDGIYEDVNGDGAVNTGDVIALFANMKAAQNAGAPFDFNKDGAVNTGDLVFLFQSRG